MKKLSALLLIGISCSAFLFGCGKQEETPEETPSATVQETAESLPPETVAETETAAEDVPPEEGMVRSTLTNEWISGDIADQRPIAVMVPNDSSALPHYSLSKAGEYLHVHKNTLVYRLNKIREQLNMNPLSSNTDREFMECFYYYLKRR